MHEENFLLGYLAHYVSPQRGYYGGLLVTDTRGIPREFRHSEAIKPTRIQSLLYGDCLEMSLGTDALAPELYNALTLKPDILLIDKASRELFGSFLLRYPPCAFLVPLSDPDYALPDRIAFEGSSLDATEFILKGSTHEKLYAYIEDLHYKGNSVLKSAELQMNLFNPFERVRTVLAEISQSEQGRQRK